MRKDSVVRGGESGEQLAGNVCVYVCVGWKVIKFSDLKYEKGRESELAACMSLTFRRVGSPRSFGCSEGPESSYDLEISYGTTWYGD